MSDKPIVVCRGATSKKFVNGASVETDVTPCVGQDRMGHFGVGIISLQPDGIERIWLWGLIMPRHLIQSWRAMKLLEETPRIDVHRTLSHYWTLAGEMLYGYSDRLLNPEGAAFGDYEKFRETRARVLAQFPNDDELNAMLAIIAGHELDIDFKEIEKERATLHVSQFL